MASTCFAALALLHARIDAEFIEPPVLEALQRLADRHTTQQSASAQPSAVTGYWSAPVPLKVIAGALKMERRKCRRFFASIPGSLRTNYRSSNQVRLDLLDPTLRALLIAAINEANSTPAALKPDTRPRI